MTYRTRIKYTAEQKTELFIYNNMIQLGRWTLEPSLKFSQQKTDSATNSDIDLVRWTPEIPGPIYGRTTCLWRSITLTSIRPQPAPVTRMSASSTFSIRATAETFDPWTR